MSFHVRELTPPGPGAIAVLELMGAGAAPRLQALGAKLPGEGEPRLVRLREDGELLDEALCIARGPDRFELHLHGSPAVVRRVCEALAGEPWPAPVSLEERALAALAKTRTDSAARILLDQSEGALRSGLEELQAFSEGDRSFRGKLDELLEAGRIGRHLFHPPRMVLAGPANAGKSTLFNLLVGAERVVVDRTPGTTRDAVFEEALLGAYAVELGDLAGERELPAASAAGASRAPADEIESRGQARARTLTRASDLVLWLSPAAAPVPPPREAGGELEGILLREVHTRADEVSRESEPGGVPRLSVHADPAGARRVVEESFHDALRLPRSPHASSVSKGPGPRSAVPFHPDDLELLTGLAGESSVARRKAAIESLLAR